jgi:hypothetical protein
MYSLTENIINNHLDIYINEQRRIMTELSANASRELTRQLTIINSLITNIIKLKELQKKLSN